MKCRDSFFRTCFFTVFLTLNLSALISSVSDASTIQSNKKRARFYCVKKDQTFSQIAEDEFGNPIYAKEGSVDQLKKLNPQIFDIDYIYPDEALLRSNQDISDVPTCIPEKEIIPQQIQDKKILKNSFRIQMLGGFSIESLKIKSKSSNFSFNGTTPLLFQVGSSYLLKENLFVFGNISTFDLKNSSTVAVKNHAPLFLHFGFQQELHESQFWKVQFQFGLETLPALTIESSDQFKIESATSRFYGLEFLRFWNDYQFGLKIKSYGSVGQDGGPYQDFLRYGISSSRMILTHYLAEIEYQSDNSIANDFKVARSFFSMSLKRDF